MREGKVKGNQQTFPTEDAGDAAVDYMDQLLKESCPDKRVQR